MSDSASTPAADVEPDLAGRTIGQYRLLRRLGRGGMAEVYLAEQESLRRQVAVKVLRSSLGRDDTYIRRFEREAQAAAALVHPNIVQIYEVGCHDGVHFIAQEYVSGLNLRQHISQKGGLEAAPAVNIMRQVAAGLHRAAMGGIVHRDIKPENIMIARDGQVKVADFGLARVAGGDGDALNLTQVGVTMGTPLYMSPEQIEGRDLDTRSDLYSFGVTCYHMLAGRPPFEGETPLAVAVQHLKSEPPSLHEERADLPAGLCDIVHRLLEKSPGDRYGSAVEILRDLRSLDVEGVDEDWAAGLEDWSPAERSAISGPRSAATERLDRLMKTSSLPTQSTGRTFRLWVLAGLLAFAVGASLAWRNRPEPLLSVDKSQLPPVQRADSPREQYNMAVWLNTEQSWKAVTDYFPPAESSDNQYYGRRAKQRLADLYMRSNDLSRAMTLFEELADLGPGEAEFHAYGLAGQALVHAQRNDPAKTRQALAELAPVRDKLDPVMRDRIDQLSNRRADADGASRLPGGTNG